MVSSSVSWDDGSGGRLISGTTTAKDYIGEPHTVGSSSKKSPALFFDIKGSWYSTPVEYEGERFGGRDEGFSCIFLLNEERRKEPF